MTTYDPTDDESRDRLDQEHERGPVTVYELACYRLGLHAGESGLTGADFDRVRLPIMGGCEVCHATVAAYNACPSRTGFLRCASGCIAGEGWDTADEANRAIFPEEYAWQGVGR
jgi:hypothetical protein